MYAGSDSKFVRHGPCDRCGSRDNVAWYSNGTGFCFGCGTLHRDLSGARRHNPGSVGDEASSTTDVRRTDNGSSKGGPAGSVQYGNTVRPLPADTGTYYSESALEWLRKYELGVTDALKYNIKWSPSREQLLYIFYGEGTDVVLWQARNMREGTSHKDRFFTGGLPEKVIAAYHPAQGPSKTAVVVEDCVSAIKLAKSGYTGIPVLGAKMSGGKMTRLCNTYGEVVWWLDSDKFSAAVKQSNLCKLLDTKSRVINSAYDPKEYTVVEIQDMMDDARYR